MLIWRGWGILVVGCFLAGYFGAMAGASSVWGSPLDDGHESLAVLAGMLIAAALTFAVDRVLARVTAPAPQGGRLRLAPHSLFYIPVKYWTFIFVAVGLFAYFKGSPA